MSSVHSFIHPVHQAPVHLGRSFARRTVVSHAKHLALHNFLALLPDDFAPTVFDNTSGIQNWGMMGNDQLGDCTIAAPGHLVQAWTAAEGQEFTIPDSDILAAYSLFDGYVPGDPSTDRGGDMLTVQQDWKSKGIGGKFITDFAEVNISQMRVQQAVCVFGGVNVGVQLPQGFQAQVGGTFDFDPSQPVAPPDPTLGHDMALVEYDLEGVTFITWAAQQRATWRWLMYYADEILAIISPDWKKSPIPVDQLVAALQQMGS